MDTNMIAVGNTGELKGSLKFWRIYRNLSQKDLAMMCGVTTQTITNLETGKYQISKSMLITVAYNLKINEDQILTPYEIKGEFKMYKYKVYKIYNDNHRELIGETFAVSREKAISNVRYRKTKDIGWGLYGKGEKVNFDAVPI